MLSTKWWSKNVIPRYGFSKEDIKSFPNADQRMKSASNQIITLKLSAQGGKHELALMRLDQLLSFILDVGTYARFKALMDAYKIESLTGVADIKAARATAETEFSFQKTKSEAIDCCSV